jgi:hypothetical protein
LALVARMVQLLALNERMINALKQSALGRRGTSCTGGSAVR